MSSALEKYQRHIRKRLASKGYAAWPPGRVLQLGDVVVLGPRGDLRKQTDLRQLKIELAVESGDPQSISTRSEHVREAIGRAGANVLGVASGTLELVFQEKGAVVFEGHGYQHLQIGNLAEINRRVIDLHREGKWQKSWCLVDQLWWVATGTIIVSETDEAAIVISAKGDLSQLSALADPVEVTVDVQSGSVAKVVGGRDFAAMFTAMRLNFWKSDMKPVSSRDLSADEDEPQLVRLSLDEVEEAWRAADVDG